MNVLSDARMTRKFIDEILKSFKRRIKIIELASSKSFNIFKKIPDEISEYSRLIHPHLKLNYTHEDSKYDVEGLTIRQTLTGGLAVISNTSKEFDIGIALRVFHKCEAYEIRVIINHLKKLAPKVLILSAIRFRRNFKMIDAHIKDAWPNVRVSSYFFGLLIIYLV